MAIQIQTHGGGVREFLVTVNSSPTGEIITLLPSERTSDLANAAVPTSAFEPMGFITRLTPNSKLYTRLPDGETLQIVDRTSTTFLVGISTEAGQNTLVSLTALPDDTLGRLNATLRAFEHELPQIAATVLGKNDDPTHGRTYSSQPTMLDVVAARWDHIDTRAIG